MAAFEKALEDFKLKVLERDAAFTRSAAEQVVDRLVDMTPAKTGRSKGNWRVRLKRPAKGVLKRKDMTGSTTKRAARRALARVKPGSTVFITNNWFVTLILNRGTVHQRPLAMIDRTIVASPLILRRALEDAKRAAP